MTRQPLLPEEIAGARPITAPPQAGPLTVSQITAMIKRAVEMSLPPTVQVVGQLSNCKRHTSGHLYVTLKDAYSEIACVMWKTDFARLKFKVADGLEVIATGGVEVFERAGRYQLYIRKLEPRGIGALELAYRQLCERLRAQGWFDARRKKPLPAFPRQIAIVTSPTGAAIADMLRTIRRKFPCAHVLIHPVRVQGGGAAAEIAGAIQRVNAFSESLGGVDVMIVARGGGSLEDLWAFNEEIVAQAVFSSRVPVISGVGHETDVTICDLVADVRAATPTAAADIAVPDRAEALAGVATMSRRVIRATAGRLQLLKSRLEGLAQRRPLREPLLLVRHRAQSIDEAGHRCRNAAGQRLTSLRRRVERAETAVRRIAPHAYLLHMGLRLREAGHRLRFAMNCSLHLLERGIAQNHNRLRRAPRIAKLPQAGERVDRLSYTIFQALRHRLALARSRTGSLEALLAAVSHEHVMARGFSITRTKKGRKIVRSVKDLTDRERVVTQLADGEFESETVNIRQMELFD